jgi:hypothetical protein
MAALGASMPTIQQKIEAMRRYVAEVEQRAADMKTWIHLCGFIQRSTDPDQLDLDEYREEMSIGGRPYHHGE